MVRLDRFVANHHWIDNYPDYKVYNLDFYSSDHRPIRMNTNPNTMISIRDKIHRFTFEHKLIIEEDFEEIVGDC